MFKTYRSYSNAHDTLIKITSECIRQAMEMSKHRLDDDGKNLLSRFMENGCSEEEAITMAIDMMVAGIDTSAHTVAWTLYYLADNEEIQDILLKEINRVLNYSS